MTIKALIIQRTPKVKSIKPETFWFSAGIGFFNRCIASSQDESFRSGACGLYVNSSLLVWCAWLGLRRPEFSDWNAFQARFTDSKSLANLAKEDNQAGHM